MTARIDNSRENDFWVFGYGSLMWKPGFAHVETVRARLHGYRRSLCIYSHVHRGTPDHPGLVLGLDAGGSCLGIAFRVPGDMAGEVMAYLREREMSNGVYHEKRLRLHLADGREGEALAYVADRRHRQYAGGMKPDEAAAIIASARRIVVLADAEKFDGELLVSFGRLADLDILVTDAPPPADLVAALNDADVEVWTA